MYGEILYIFMFLTIPRNNYIFIILYSWDFVLIYITISTLKSACPYCPCRRLVLSNFTISVVGSQNVIDKSCLVCIKREKYTFLVTLRPLVSMRRGKVELCTLHYKARQRIHSQALYIKTHFRINFKSNF